MESNLYFGGIPTEPDVRAIREAYPEKAMKAGDVITYEEIERVIGEPRSKSRFRTVTNRWRKVVERETGRIVIGVIPNVGFKVLDNTEKLDLGHRYLGKAARSSRRSYVVASRVERRRLSEDEKRRLGQLQQRSAQLIAAAQIRGKANSPKITSEEEK